MSRMISGDKVIVTQVKPHGTEVASFKDKDEAVKALLFEAEEGNAVAHIAWLRRLQEEDIPQIIETWAKHIDG